MVLLTQAKKNPLIHVVVLLGFAALSLLPFGCGKAEPTEPVTPATVTWKSASQAALEEWTEIVGTTMPVLPNRFARVSTRVDGTVSSVLVGRMWVWPWPLAEGDRVEKGTVLGQLDTTNVSNNLGEALLNQDSLVSEKISAQGVFDQASRDLERWNRLAKSDERPRTDGFPIVTPAQLETATTALKDAQAKLTGAVARLAAGAKRVEALRDQLKYHTLTAPISGRVGRIQVMPGQTITAGTAITDVIDIDEEIDVLCFVPASVAARLETEMEAHTGRIEDDQADTAKGQIVYIAQQAEPETGNFAVKVRFANDKVHLLANRIVRISILLKNRGECLSVPESAVEEDTETPTIVVVEKKMIKNEKGVEEPAYFARRLGVVLGTRDRKLKQIEILNLIEIEKESDKKKAIPPIKGTDFVTVGAQGLQTGDPIKQDTDDD